MNGFKDDVISILRDNVILQDESVGWIMGEGLSYSDELAEVLTKENFLVVRKSQKPVVLFDYIVIPDLMHELWVFIKALTLLADNGILVVDITMNKNLYDEHAFSVFGGFSTTKVKYDANFYLVIKKGVDYGN